jgi:hypothetical protein
MRIGIALGLAVCLTLAAGETSAACSALVQKGSIPLVKQGGIWLVPVGINGTPKTMLLDTSIGQTLITPEAVAELKLPRRESRTARYIASDGARSYAFTNIDRLALGLAGQFNNSDYTLDADLPNGAKRAADAPAGRIGLELLTHFDFDLDMKNGVLNLFDWNHCEGQVVYWKADAVVPVNFDWDPMGRIRFKVTLDDTPLYAVIDTSAPVDTVNLTYFKSKTGFDENAPGVEHLPDMEDGGKLYSAHFKTLDIYGLKLNSPVLRLREDMLARQVRAGAALGTSISNTESKRQPDITLGVSSLAKLHVYVASKEKKLYISAAP